jgi:hypothetical protein
MTEPLDRKGTEQLDPALDLLRCFSKKTQLLVVSPAG